MLIFYKAIIFYPNEVDEVITKWIINTPDENAVKELSGKGGLSPLAVKTMACAGITTIEKAAAFFGQESDDENEQNEEEFSDPFLIRDMDKACELINDAV